jgi:catechol-2,3-dioxygenase
MLENANAVATIGVKSLENARNFYQGKLGLIPQGEKNEDVQL